MLVGFLGESLLQSSEAKHSALQKYYFKVANSGQSIGESELFGSMLPMFLDILDIQIHGKLESCVFCG